MRLVIAAAIAFGSAASAWANNAPARMPAQKAFDSVREGPAQACMQGAYLSHTAYTASVEHKLRCSELLSTDTLIRTRHWDRT